jgi:type IV pilus assembly protein PilP
MKTIINITHLVLLKGNQLKCLIVSALWVVFLSACGNQSNDDLDAYIRNAGKDVQTKIQPLPDMKTYLTFDFNADGSLSDPFLPRKSYGNTGTLKPDSDRPKQPMEAYPLESISYVGMIEKPTATYALLKTPDNNVQQVKIGNFVGQNFGQVVDIKESEIVLKEIVQDNVTGSWVEKITTIALHE